MSIIPAPPKKILSVNKKSRENKIFTIHKRNQPFIVRQDIHKESSINSTVISFKRETDAIQFAYMIESHKKHTNAWPSTTIEDMTSLFVKDSLVMDEPYFSNELYLKSWNIADLRTYSASNMLNLFIIHSMILKEGNIYTLKGSHLSLSMPIEEYAKILEKMFQRESIKDINDE